MRFLLGAAILATLAWGGYWLVGSQALDRAVAVALSDSPVLRAQDHRVRGFPNRFDLTLTEPRVTLPGLDWRAPFVQVFALSYRPHHVIAVFPHDQGLVLDGQPLTLTTTDLRMSAVMDPMTDLPLNRTALVAQSPVLAGLDWTQRADALRIATRRTAPEAHDWVIEGETVFPDAAQMNTADPDGIWPRRFDLLRLEGGVTLDRPLDRHALVGRLPHLADLTLTGARLHWDGTRIDATGTLRLDGAGRLTGTIALTIDGVADLWARIEAAELIAPDYLPLARATLSGLIRPDAPDRIEAALAVQRGVLMLGPVPLLELPLIRF